MIYLADGPSDIPAFSLVHQNGGATFAVYPKGDNRAMQQVEQINTDLPHKKPLLEDNFSSSGNGCYVSVI
ncbi:MAG: hypothetical protein LUC95_08035 [Lachnospiraceae bacterium]|nr:hypothetical protein [Lachnospiraceae bacterium]